MNLYTFAINDEPTYYFTSAKADVTLNNQVYSSTTLRRTSYKLDSIETKNTLTVLFPGDNEFARDFIHPTRDTLKVDVALLDGTIFYRGRLVTASYNPNNQINLTFEPLVRLGLRVAGETRLFQSNCPFELYGVNCRAIRRLHRVEVISISGKDVRVTYDTGNANNSSRPNSLQVLPTYGGVKAGIGSLVGGFLNKFEGHRDWWITDIKNPTASGSIVTFTVTIFTEPIGLKVADEAISVSFGCRRDKADCQYIHDNLQNYGGFPGMHIPSAFDGGIRQ